jgi:hypothetical protein
MNVDAEPGRSVAPRRIMRVLTAVLIGLTASVGPLAAQQVVRLPARDSVLAREPRALFSVGTADGRTADAFGAVADVAFDAAENLYVLDRLNARVVVFDSTGRLARTMGRRGGGPGELGAPQQMAVTRAGDVIVSDAGRRALIVFHADGTTRSVPYPGVSMLIGRTLSIHPRGGIVSVAMGNPAARDADAFGEEVLLWVPTGAGAARPLATVSTPRSRASGSGGIRVHAPPIFSPSFRFALLPTGGVALVDGAAYSIRIVDPGGRVVRVLQRPIPPRRVTARDREHEMQRRARELSDGGGLRLVGARSGPMPAPVRRGMAEQLRESEFARVMPVIRRIAVDGAGTLWIERTGASPGVPGGVDVVNAQGRYLGTLAGWELPVAFSPRGRAAYIREDELGVQRVLVVRL